MLLQITTIQQNHWILPISVYISGHNCIHICSGLVGSGTDTLLESFNHNKNIFRKFKYIYIYLRVWGGVCNLFALSEKNERSNCYWWIVLRFCISNNFKFGHYGHQLSLSHFYNSIITIYKSQLDLSSIPRCLNNII